MGEGQEHAVERAIGERIRRRRVELGLTQHQLGQSIGLSYQQIQKYERGTSRIAASTLFTIAGELRVPPGYFFDDLVPRDDGPGHGGTLRPAIDVARSYAEIGDIDVRSALAGLVRAIARHGR
jgi:transcriptional regulator with XRE-family HTH domain